MNRFVIIILSAIIFFVGCEANFDPSESGTTQESASTVVSVKAFPLVERQREFGESSQLFYDGMIPDADVQMRVRAYFYQNNKLVGSVAKLVDNVRNDVVLTKTDLSTSINYNVIVVADFVIKDGNSIDLEFWKVVSDSDYNNIKLVDQGYTGLEYRSVGVAYASVRGGERLTLDIEGLGALAYMYFSNIDYREVCQVTYSWRDVKEYLLAERRVVSSATYYDTYDVDPAYSGFYDRRYIIPTDGGTCKYGWKLKNISGSTILEDEVSISMTPSDNRIWEVNCSTTHFSNEYFNY